MLRRFFFLSCILVGAANLFAQVGLEQIQFQSTAYSANEADSLFFVVVERVGIAAVSVDCLTRDMDALNGATSGVDYMPVTTTLSWAAGETASKIIPISMIDDGLAEGNEVFEVVLENPVGATLGSADITVVTIVDDETLPSTVTLQNATYTVLENAGMLTVGVVRSGDLTNDATVDVLTVELTASATAGTDYTSVNETVFFSGGDGGPLFVNIPILPDGIPEADETFEIHLANPTGPVGFGVITVAVATIQDAAFVPGEIQFTTSTFTVDEFESGMLVTVERVLGTDGTASVDFETFDSVGTALLSVATPGVDYTTTTETVNWADGEGGSKTIVVPILDDTLLEGDEDFDMRLFNPVGAGLASLSNAIGTIVDDEVPLVGEVRFVSALYSVDESVGNMEVQVERVNGTSGAVSVAVSSSEILTNIPGVATLGTDFGAVSQIVGYLDGESGMKTVLIPIIEDTEVEGDEDFNVLIDNPTGGVTIGSPSVATGRIVDNDFILPGELSFSQTIFTTGEGDGSVQVEVIRQNGSDGVVSATISTFPITSGATPGSDYTPLNTTVSFLDGDVSPKFISISILEDTEVEGDEDFGVDLTDPQGGATIGTPFQTVVRISDNDVEPPGEIQLSQAQYTVNENGKGVIITIERVNGSGGAVSAVFETFDLTDNAATPGLDYNPVNTVVNFADGDVSPKAIPITILDDAIFEGDETFQTRLSNPTGGATIGTPGQAEVVIVDNELPEHGDIRFDAALYSVTEGDTALTVGIERVNGTDGEVSVAFSTAFIAGGALPGDDYQTTTSTVVFLDGQAGPMMVSIPIVDDTLVEDPEDFALELSTPTGGATLTTPSTAVASILDNDEESNSGSLRFSQSAYSVNESDDNLVVTVERVDGSDGQLQVEVSTDGRFRMAQATSGLDYVPVSQILFWADGDTSSKSVAISIIDDDEVEDPEVFGIGLFDSSGLVSIVAPQQAEITIIDDDFENSVVSFTETEYLTSESQAQLFAGIIRTGDLNGQASVQFQTLGGSARNNEDFQVVSQTVNFQPGDQFKTVTVPILDDGDVENTESFQVQLLNPTGPLELGTPNQITVFVEDNDEPPPPGRLAFTRARFGGGEENGPITVEIERLNGDIGPLTAIVRTQNDTALAGEDYTARSVQIQFADGETGVKSLRIPLINDSIPETLERFRVELLDSAGHTDSAEVLIQDDDRLEVRWARPGQDVDEGGQPAKQDVTVQVEAVLTAALSETVTVPYSVRGIAKSGEDHNLQNGVLTFESGNTSAFLEFQVFDDDKPEPHEPIEIKLEDDVVRVGAPRHHLVLIRDNDQDKAPQTRIISPAPDSRPVSANTPLEFSAEVVGGDPSAFSYSWEAFATNGSFSTSWEGRSTSQSFPEPGHYEIICFAREGDSQDLTPARARVIVVDKDTPRIFDFIPEGRMVYLKRGQSQDFSAKVDPAEATAEWYLADNPDNKVTGLSFSKVFNRNGIFVVAFKAALNGAESIHYVTIVVSDSGTPPTQLTINEPVERTFAPGQDIHFSGSVGFNTKKMDFDLGWVMSDGTRLKGAQGTHAFSKPGRVRVRFVGLGGSKRLEDSITLNIVDPDQAPELDINIPTDLALEPGESVFLSARTLNGRGYTPDQMNFFWDLGDGRTVRAAVPGEIAYEEEGTYTITLYGIVNETGVQTDVVTRSVTVQASTPDRFEPNDDFPEAAALTPGKYNNQSLDDASPIDIYSIEVTADGQRLVLDLNLSETVVVEVLNSAFKVISTRVLNQSETFTVQGLSMGTYYVRILSQDSSALKRKDGLSYSISVSVLNPALYLSDIQTNESYVTQVGIVNPSNAAVSAEIVGYDSEGNLVESVSLELAALGRSHQSMEEIFGDNAESITWVQVDATRDLFGYSRTANRDEKEVYGITASNRLSTELFVPHIAERTEQWYTRANVVNGSSLSSNSQIQMPADSRDLLLTKGFAKDNFDFLDRFDGSLPGEDLWATMKDKDGKASLAGNEIFGLLKDKRVIAGLQLADVRQDNPNFTFIGNNIYFTHIARNVDAFWTGIALVNIGESSQSVNIRAFGDDGVELGSKIRTLQVGEKVVELADEFLDGMGTPANVDWVLVEADLQIVGYELFGTHDGNRIAGLEASTALSKNLCFPFIDTNSDVAHGISVVNVTDEPITANFTLYSDQGVPLATTTRSLSGKEKYSITIEELFISETFDEINVPGWLECTSSQPLAGFELFLNIGNGEQMGALIAQ